jgi:hypothetical protein
MERHILYELVIGADQSDDDRLAEARSLTEAAVRNKFGGAATEIEYAQGINNGPQRFGDDIIWLRLAWIRATFQAP